MKKSKYNAKFFLKLFSAIPRNKWITGRYISTTDPSCGCAIGHLRIATGRDGSAMENAARDMASGFLVTGGLASVNDGKSPLFKQKTPKARVVALFRKLVKLGK